MDVVNRANPRGEQSNGVEVTYSKGVPEPFLRRCDTYQSKDVRETVLDEPRRQIAISAAEKMAEDGLRVLAFASGSIRDTPKPG